MWKRKSRTHDPEKDAPQEVRSHIYYRMIIATAILYLLAATFTTVKMGQSYDKRDEMLHERIEKPWVLVINDGSASIVRLGNEGDQNVRLFTTISLRQLLDYSAYSIKDAVYAAQQLCSPRVSYEYEQVLLEEKDFLLTVKGEYETKFSDGDITTSQGEEIGDYVVVVDFIRVFTNDVDPPKPQHMQASLIVREKESYRTSQWKKKKTLTNFFGMKIVKMEFEYLNE